MVPRCATVRKTVRVGPESLDAQQGCAVTLEGLHGNQRLYRPVAKYCRLADRFRIKADIRCRAFVVPKGNIAAVARSK